MNKSDLLKKLNAWLSEVVEKPNTLLGNWAPCPYAKQARLQNKIEIIVTDNLVKAVEEGKKFLESKEVVIIAFDHNLIDALALQKLVEDINQKLMLEDYVLLEDHPNLPEFINTVKMNFDYCGLLLMQRLSKINDAADKLRQQGYYDNWSEENYDDVVSWRYK